MPESTTGASERFLLRLEAELRQEVSSMDAAVIVEETRDHLQESIQARLELGLSSDEAEREAILAFGEAHQIREEVRRRAPKLDRRFLLACGGVIVYWGLIATIKALPDWGMVPLVVLASLVHATFILTSVYARRPQVLALGLATIPLWLGWSVFQAATHVVEPTAYSLDERRTHREWVPDEIRRNRESAARLREEARTVAQGHVAFLRTKGRSSPSRQASFTSKGRLRLFRRPDHATAQACWDAALSNIQSSSEHGSRALEAKVTALEDAARAPWWPNVPSEMVLSLSEGVGAVVATYGSLHLAAWAMGQALRRRRHRRNGTLA